MGSAGHARPDLEPAIARVMGTSAALAIEARFGTLHTFQIGSRFGIWFHRDDFGIYLQSHLYLYALLCSFRAYPAFWLEGFVECR